MFQIIKKMCSVLCKTMIITVIIVSPLRTSENKSRAQEIHEKSLQPVPNIRKSSQQRPTCLVPQKRCSSKGIVFDKKALKDQKTLLLRNKIDQLRDTNRQLQATRLQDEHELKRLQNNIITLTNENQYLVFWANYYYGWYHTYYNAYCAEIADNLTSTNASENPSKGA